MTDPFVAVAAALDAVRAAWIAAGDSDEGADGVTGAPLVALHDAVSYLRRQVDGIHLQVAARIAQASRPDLGNAGLARQQGFRTPAALIAASTGGTTAAAVQLVTVSTATTPRASLLGDVTRPKRPAVAEAVGVGRISVDAAAGIVGLLDKVAMRVDPTTLDEAEAKLVEQAEGLSLEQFRKILQRAEAWLDPDGVAPREDELRTARYVRIRQDRTGAIRIDAALDPETGAPVLTAVDALVAAQLRSRDDGGRARDAGGGPARDADGGPARDADGRMAAIDGAIGETDAVPLARIEDRRTMDQMRADALSAICRHALGCDDADVPTAGATVIVRMSLDDLESGRGHATVDGLAQPISVATARRMAAGSGVIPCVLDGDGEILDFGRSRRLFTPSQKLALVERDGGCGMCGAPPSMTQVHHIRWWTRDVGPTDLDNGILLCVRCHHRIHDDGWEIEIRGRGVGAEVLFIPPAHVDPFRRPRLGGRRRFDYVPAA